MNPDKNGQGQRAGKRGVALAVRYHGKTSFKILEYLETPEQRARQLNPHDREVGTASIGLAVSRCFSVIRYCPFVSMCVDCVGMFEAMKVFIIMYQRRDCDRYGHPDRMSRLT